MPRNTKDTENVCLLGCEYFPRVLPAEIRHYFCSALAHFPICASLKQKTLSFCMPSRHELPRRGAIKVLTAGADKNLWLYSHFARRVWIIAFGKVHQAFSRLQSTGEQTEPNANQLAVIESKI